MTAWLKTAVAGAITLATALLGGWDRVIEGLVFFLVADYVTALVRAIVTGRFDSSVGIRGIFRKLAQLAGVAVAHALDIYVFAGTPWARTLTAVIFTLNEVGSTIANLAAVGVPLPAQVTKALQVEIERKKGG